ncbi:MAG TPA: phosphotransferase [Ktedonobacterales bacterium]|nr:phosphotransferase [Ktedonobacterales bacterium]
MTEPDDTLAAARAAWPLPSPWRVTALAGGTNNVVERVETPAGRFVLRRYGNHANPARLTFEHGVLASLAAQGLPFAVPLPRATATGATYAILAGADGAPTLATLTPLIPGAPPPRADVALARAAGEALARLDVALAKLPPPDSGAGLTWRATGDLAHCHPLVPDPLAALAALPLAPEERERLGERYAWLLAHLPALYATLPRQLCHEDFDPSNVLVAAGRVSGVLDFEFCTRDLRVVDLTVPLTWWPVAVFGTGAEWPLIAALAAGYARQVALGVDEIAALPTLFLLRALSSLIHRLGRHRQGLCPLEDALARARAALARCDWLAAHGQRLMETVAGAASG